MFCRLAIAVAAITRFVAGFGLASLLSVFGVEV